MDNFNPNEWLRNPAYNILRQQQRDLERIEKENWQSIWNLWEHKNRKHAAGGRKDWDFDISGLSDRRKNNLSPGPEEDDELGPLAKGVLFFVALLAAFYLPYWIADQFGFGEELMRLANWHKQLSSWLGYPILAVYFLIGFAIEYVAVVATIRILTWGTKAFRAGADWLAYTTEVAIDTLARLIAAGLRSLFGLLFWPFRVTGEYLWDLVSGWIALLAQHREEQRELRRLYRAEFRDRFRSFRAFKRAWEAMDGDEDPFAAQEDAEQADDAAREEPKPDSYQAALALLGLSEPFSKAELESRYRTLMKGVHPDTAGPNDLARQVNEARALIKQRKRWK